MDTLQSDLQRYKAVSQFGLLGPEDSVSFRIDCKPQPSNDLNIKLQDELQCCLASNEQNFNVKISVLLLCQCQCTVMCGRVIWGTVVQTGPWPIHNNILMCVFLISKLAYIVCCVKKWKYCI